MSLRTVMDRARVQMILVCLPLIATAGCRDDSPSDDAHRRGDDAAMTAPSDIASAAERSEARLRSRNKHDWVGKGHNKMLDDFRVEMRKPGTLSQNICEFVASFSMNDARLPAASPRSSDGNWRAVQATADSSSLCTSQRKLRLSSGGLMLSSSLAPASAGIPSTTAIALLGEIEGAISASPDARILANQLNGVLDRSQSLTELERTVVEATVSVAHNSFTYWSSQYSLFEEEVIAEYSPCIQQQLSLGNTDRITGTCFLGKGEGGTVAWGYSPDATAMQRLIAARSRRFCGPKLGEGFRRIAYADAKGAWTGGFAGGLAGGLAGAFGGALVGGGANSIFAAGENAWETLKCMYGMT